MRAMLPRLVVSKGLAPSRSKVDSAEERAGYWRALLADWNVPGRKGGGGFPGCNPVSIGRSTLSHLSARQYCVALKSDGVRYVLYCTTRPGSTPDRPLPVALMIDRSHTMYEVDVVAHEDVFLKRTILEGELVWQQPDESTLLFLVFDCVRCMGESMTSKPYSVRLAEVQRRVGLNEEIAHADDVEARALETGNIVMMQYVPRVVMRAKYFVHIGNAANLWRDRGETDHRVDGLILHCVDSPYAPGTAAGGEVLKWKEVSTVDLAGPDLRAADGPLFEAYDGRKVVRKESKIVPAGTGDVIEYVVSVTAEQVELFAQRRRLDKTQANANRIVAATIRDVLDAVQPHELVTAGQRWMQA